MQWRWNPSNYVNFGPNFMKWRKWWLRWYIGELNTLPNFSFKLLSSQGILTKYNCLQQPLIQYSYKLEINNKIMFVQTKTRQFQSHYERNYISLHKQWKRETKLNLNWQCTLHKAQGITNNTNKNVWSTDTLIALQASNKHARIFVR